MEEFTDITNINLQELSAEVIESFGERYLHDANRVISTGLVYSGDEDMCRTALAIVIGLYFKNLTEGIYSSDRSVH